MNPIDRVVCFGELLLRSSAPGKELLLQSPHLEVHIGGAAANVAVSLRKLGHMTSRRDPSAGQYARPPRRG
jgi:2-dehydro-3-deoxygluconokinase